MFCQYLLIIYITDSYLRLNSFLECYSHNTSKKSLLNDERIVASVLIESLNDGRQQMEKYIEKLENSIDKAEEWKEKLKALENEIQSIMGQIPSPIRNYYGINYRVENR